MNLRLTVSIFASAIFMLSASAEYTFKEKSVLADGKWVKIEIGETGLYSISYDMLREMGFENPENVGVYGKGGRLMNLQMSPSSPKPADGFPYTDDLSQITSLHRNDALLFWGEGLENVYFNPGSSTTALPYFENFRQNIYSTSTYYFLSDKETPLEPEEADVSGSSFLSLTNGWGYVRHELDLEYNSTRSGKLYWGENFLTDGAEKSWTVPVNNMTGGVSHLSYQIYTAPNDKATILTRCSSGDREKTFSFKNGNNNYFYPLKGRLSADPYKNATPDTMRFVNDPAESVNISISAADIEADCLNLDYWLLTYPKEIKANPLSETIASDLYHFKGTKKKSYKIPLSPGLCAWDLTDPRNARKLPVNSSDAETVNFTIGNETVIPILIFDPARAHKQITAWSEVINTDIHSMAAEGWDLLVVTVPRFRNYAEHLAEIHRRNDGAKVAVVTPEDIYNEFSGGIPDPMAYRAAAKHFYNYGLKNLLLLGPSMREMRFEVAGETWKDRHIAFQHSYVKPDEEAVPAFDFYGVMRDNPVESSLQAETKNIGVGLLSCESEGECERILRKIETYLSSDDHAWSVNETMTIGGIGDEHTHDKQAVDAGQYITSAVQNGGMAHNTVIIDAYGNVKARKQFFSLLDRGKIWNLYFGHGGGWSMGSDDFLTTGDLQNLKNTRPGFLFMGGCDFSKPEVRVRGIGEGLVLDTDYGMIGAVVTTRAAWSGQNKQLADKFSSQWLRPEDRANSPTIGEIFARAKSGSSNLNDLCFILSSDPSLKVPSPIAGVEISTKETVTPGEKIHLKGIVLDDSGKQDAGFNGKIVVKLMEPAVTLRSNDYETNTCRTLVKNDQGSYYPTIDIPYESTLVSATEGEINGGEFDMEFTVPAAVSRFTGQTMRIKAGVFDKSRWLGGAGSATISVTDNPAEETDKDTSAPMVNFSYDNTRSLLELNIVDDSALALSPAAYNVKIDGHSAVLIAKTAAASGETSISFDGYCDVADLEEGSHEVHVIMTDIAGNASEDSFIFEKLAPAAPIRLSLPSKAVVDKLLANAAGEFEGSLEVEIKDVSGNVIHTFTAPDGEIEWDLCDKTGNRVEEGYYRICVRDSKAVPIKYSESEEFAII